MTVEVSGWGRFPVAQAKPLILKDSATLSETLRTGFRGIAYGMGRSYGDSALSIRDSEVRDDCPAKNSR